MEFYGLEGLIGDIIVTVVMLFLVFVGNRYMAWSARESMATREAGDALCDALGLRELRFERAGLRRPASVDVVGYAEEAALQVTVEQGVAAVEWGVGLGVSGGWVASKREEARDGDDEASLSPPVGEVQATGDAAFDARFEVRGDGGAVEVLEVLDSGFRGRLMELSEQGAEVTLSEEALRVVWDREAFLGDALARVEESRDVLRALRRARHKGGAEAALSQRGEGVGVSVGAQRYAAGEQG